MEKSCGAALSQELAGSITTQTTRSVRGGFGTLRLQPQGLAHGPDVLSNPLTNPPTIPPIGPYLLMECGPQAVPNRLTEREMNMIKLQYTQEDRAIISQKVSFNTIRSEFDSMDTGRRRINGSLSSKKNNTWRQIVAFRVRACPRDY